MKLLSVLVLVASVLAASTIPSASGEAVQCKSAKEPWPDVPDLKGYWPLSQDWMDYSGGFNHLTSPATNAKQPTLMSSGGPPGSPGYTKFEKPSSDDGRMTVLAVENYDAITDNGDYTFEFWYKVDEFASHSGWFVSYSIGDGVIISNELYIGTAFGGNLGKCSAGKNGEVEGTVADKCAADGTWKHMAYVVDSSSSNRIATLYVDGVQIGTKSGASAISSPGTLAFGAELDKYRFPDLGLSSAQVLYGGMAEVRHWGRAMSETEVAGLMNTRYTCGSYAVPQVCTEEEEALCNEEAYCAKVDIDNAWKPKCFCPSGKYGDGFGPLGCHIEVPKVTCDPVTEDTGTIEQGSDGRRSGATVVGGVANLAGYWPLSMFSGLNDRSGMDQGMAKVNDGPTLKNTDPNAKFSDGYAEFVQNTTTYAGLSALAVQNFDTQLDGTDGSYTWEFWMRIDDTADMWFVSYATGQRNTGAARSLDNEFFMSTGFGARQKCDGGLAGAVDGDQKLCKQGPQWHHVAFVHDGANAKARLYVDGVLQKEQDYTFGGMVSDGTLMFGGELDNTDPFGDIESAIWEPEQMLNGAMTEVRYWTEARSEQQILDFMDFRLAHAQCGEYIRGDVCDEEQSNTCDHFANCESINGTATCFCEMGMIGTGYAADPCRKTGWTVRTVYENVEAVHLAWLSDPAMVEGHVKHFKECFGSNAVHFQRGVAPFSDAMHFPFASHSLMVNALFDVEPTAADMEVLEAKAASCFPYGDVGTTGTRKYTWSFATTSREQQVLPTGLTVDAVSFETSGCQSGCWVIDVTYTTGGKDAFNSFYLPNAVGDDTASYDFDYDDNTDNTFLPANFPCRTHQYTLPSGEVPESLPDQVTTCCLLENYTAVSSDDTANGFVMDYRPTQAFVDWVDEMKPYLCQGRDFPYVAVLDRSDYNETEGNPSPFIDVNFPWHSSVPHRFLNGQFKGMPNSPGVVSTTTLDPFFYQYSATIKLDEVELRQLAGQLRGTVGVEHTVDTFLGYVNFRPTGLPVVDAFATQVNIHLEKTNFFSVSTHGENAYTFLEYVNMRLISIYTQDIDFSGLNETADRTVRTDSSGNANYVQVTFTMGSQYAPNPLSGGLIPLDSVRAGRGTFISDTTLEHLCTMYDEGNATAGDDIGLTGYADDISIFDDMLDQPCGPKSNMCVSPTTVPDQFVSFNIPLGFQVFDGQASNNLENNIFVSMVINALDKKYAGPNPNGGDDPMQMKTTLEASIPIVDGGVNIFCDGITAKTDLKDVASADIIVGSANSLEELTRLRILKDIANTNLDAVASARVDSDSIEAGLMTLVLKGNSSYFAENGLVNTQGYSLELDDLITIHLMTDGEAPDLTDAQCKAAAAPKPVDCQVRALLAEPPADNSDANGLDTDGYSLNGAFEFEVSRGLGFALLKPTSDLLAICPFNPTRPSGGLPLESCITRRDVRSRIYPVRSGADGPTAMEILAQTDDLPSDNLDGEMDALEAQAVPNDCTCTVGTDCCEAGFLQMILGENNFARPLAIEFVKAIDKNYNLNGRYNRAYWINPGYEWTPTQTAGKSKFSVSQKVYLFALITMDENIGTGRRRMLLATDVNPTKDTGSGVGGGQVSFPVARTSIMAQAFGVETEKAVVFNVEMQLTQAEACMSDQKFVEAARLTFMDYLDGTASDFHTVQVLGFTRSLNGVECNSRRALRKLLAEFSAATAYVQMMIVYKKDAVLNQAEFAKMPGITSVDVDAASAANVEVDPEFVNKDGANPKGSDSGSGSSNTALIAGIAGGVGGAVLLLVGGMLFMRSRSSGGATAIAEPVQTIDVNDLKAQLSADV